MAYVRMGWPAAPHGGIGEIDPTQPAPRLGFFGELVQLPQAVSRSLAVIAASPMPAEQKRRLNCVLAIIQRPEVDDRYINGFDYVFRTLTGDLSDEQIGILLNSNRVRKDLANPLFGPGTSDQDVAAELNRLDLRILQGIATLRRIRDTQGATMSAVMRKLNDWVSASQRNPNSIYSCWA